jgi:hypothetical protein
MARYGHCKDCRAFNKCKDCRAFNRPDPEISTGVGYCNRVPPGVVFNLTTDNKHPTVLPNDGCWEFLQKPKRRGKKR